MSNLIIPTNPTSRQEMRSAMGEISNAYARIQSEKEYIKESLLALEEKHEIPKLYLSKVAIAYHKQNLSETADVINDVEELYDALFS